MAVASSSYTHTIWVKCWGSGSHVESKLYHYVIVEADSHINHCFPHPHSTYAKCLRTWMCCPWAYSSSIKQIPTLHYLGQILGVWVTCGVKMMSLCHSWGWQPHQIASHIHIRHINSVGAHWYAVHGHMTVASNSYRLVWAEPKTIATSAILYLIKLVSYHFTVESPCFYDTNRELLKRAF